MNVSFFDYLKSASIYILPHHAISRIIYKLTRIQSPLVPYAIKLFSSVFKINLHEAQYSNPHHYTTFNEFFTRQLKADARQFSASAIISPVDGKISELGSIQQGKLIQAKGIHYSLEKLLASEQDAEAYENGQFITIYLSPKDYHRIHMPCTGRLTRQVYVPGRLYSVAQHTVNTVNGIFVRNERVIAHFDTEFGKMAMTLVGAINVAAIETVWDGLITPPKGKHISEKEYPKNNIKLDKGEEMGRFNMGSTVILILDKNHPPLASLLKPQQTIQLGNKLNA